jgi:anti-sigma regulatory factor (Ser/Thr protein kinase)
MFRHEALLYEGAAGFLSGSVPFIRAGLEAQEPVLVAVRRDKIRLLEDALGADAAAVRFVDMAELGRNPARIIPAWDAFVREHGDAPAVRGIGEPIAPQHRGAELAECQLHESLLNDAFADTERFHLLCPYDVGALAPEVVHEARCSHPFVVDAAGCADSEHYRGRDATDGPATSPLAPPRTRPEVLSFQLDDLSELRALVRRSATEAGFGATDADALVLAANELASNSILHGGGFGVLRVWHEDDAVVCEVRDRGRIDDRLVGRRRPGLDQPGGWGLWIVNQTCDLVELRSGAAGTVVRARMRGRAPVGVANNQEEPYS